MARLGVTGGQIEAVETETNVISDEDVPDVEAVRQYCAFVRRYQGLLEQFARDHQLSLPGDLSGMKPLMSR